MSTYENTKSKQSVRTNALEYETFRRFKRRWLRWVLAAWIGFLWILSYFYCAVFSTRLSGPILEVTSLRGQIGLRSIEDNGIVHPFNGFEKIERRDINLTDSVDTRYAGFGWDEYKITSLEGTVHYRNFILPYWFVATATLLFIYAISAWRARKSRKRISNVLKNSKASGDP